MRKTNRAVIVEEGWALAGVGASVVNALSEVFSARVWRDGYEWTQDFSRGKPKGNLKKGKATRAHGTEIYFRPDAEIFTKTTFNAKTILEVTESKAFLNKGLHISLTDERSGKAVEQWPRELFAVGDNIRRRDILLGAEMAAVCDVYEPHLERAMSTAA